MNGMLGSKPFDPCRKFGLQSLFCIVEDHFVQFMFSVDESPLVFRFPLYRGFTVVHYLQ